MVGANHPGNSEVLWLIPARSGSKSIVDKNVRELKGMPLIGYRIQTALSLAPAEDVWVSTDSESYADLARTLGATIPFMRPATLAGDTSSSMDVVMHAMAFAASMGRTYQFIGLLEPTSPFVYRQDILNALASLKVDQEAKAIVAVRESRPNSLFVQAEAPYLDVLADNLRKIRLLNRQSLAKEITPSGGFYISRWHDFLEQKTFYSSKTLSYEVPPESQLEIDEPMDWWWAEFLLEKGVIDIQKLNV